MPTKLNKWMDKKVIERSLEAYYGEPIEVLSQFADGTAEIRPRLMFKQGARKINGRIRITISDFDLVT